MTEFRYKAFISYSHADRDVAKWLHLALEKYRIPRQVVRTHELTSNRIYPVFRDEEELGSAVSLSHTIQSALSSSENLIVVCSKSAASSAWVNKEIEFFLGLGRVDSVHCLLVDDSIASIPSTLVETREAEQAREPLAANLLKAGRTGAKLQIVAGLLDIGLDELVRRDSHRRNRRYATISAAAVIGMMVTSAIGVFAWQSQREAERQSELAQREKQKAVAVKDFLVDLFRLSEPSRKGADLTAREILDTGVKTLKTNQRLDYDTRSSMYQTVAQVHQALGYFDEAYELAVISTNLRNDANDSGAGYHESRSLVGAILYDQGRLEEAFAHAEAHLRELRETPSARQSLATAIHNVAWLHYERSDYERAMQLGREALDIRTEVFGPRSLERAESLNALAAFMLASQDAGSPAELFLDAAEIRAEFLGRDHVLTLHAYNNYAESMRRDGSSDEAERLFRANLEAALAIFDHSHPQVVDQYNYLGTALLDRGDADEAREVLAQAVATADSHYGRENWFAGYYRVMYAKALFAANRSSEAIETWQESRSIMLSTGGGYTDYVRGVDQWLSIAALCERELVKAETHLNAIPSAFRKSIHAALSAVIDSAKVSAEVGNAAELLEALGWQGLERRYISSLLHSSPELACTAAKS